MIRQVQFPQAFNTQSIKSQVLYEMRKRTPRDTGNLADNATIIVEVGLGFNLGIDAIKAPYFTYVNDRPTYPRGSRNPNYRYYERALMATQKYIEDLYGVKDEDRLVEREYKIMESRDNEIEEVYRAKEKALQEEQNRTGINEINIVPDYREVETGDQQFDILYSGVLMALNAKVVARGVVETKANGQKAYYDNVISMSNQLGISLDKAVQIIKYKKEYKGSTFKYVL